MPSPIVLFVFARPDHTKRTLEALVANDLADQSDLIIYADGARSEKELGQVNAVRKLVNSITSFRSVKVIERSSNYGLSRNIIEGVTEVCEKYGEVIVLEDDIVTSPYFLMFMNQALERYADEPRVWHISGWNYPIDLEGIGDAFMWQMMNCWGWATWADRWMHFSKDIHELKNMDKSKLRKFNLDGAYNFWSHIEKNISGEMDTWAIFWYASIFKYNALALNPTVSLVDNIGHDGSGVHCGTRDIYGYKSSSQNLWRFPESIEENIIARDQIKLFYRKNYPSLLRRLLTYPFRIFKKWMG